MVRTQWNIRCTSWLRHHMRHCRRPWQWTTYSTLGNMSSAQATDSSEPCQISSRGEYPDLFTGLGHLNGRKIKLHVDREVHTGAQHYRCVPFHIHKHSGSSLRKTKSLVLLREEEVMLPVVVVPKPKQPSKVHACRLQGHRQRTTRNANASWTDNQIWHSFPTDSIGCDRQQRPHGHRTTRTAACE